MKQQHIISLKWILPSVLLSLSACGDGHSGDEEEGHYSTYDLANSDTTPASVNSGGYSRGVKDSNNNSEPQSNEDSIR